MQKGILLLLCSALNFALSTAFVKLITNESNIQAIQLSFLRFLSGFFVIACYIIIRKKSIRPNNIKYILLRAVLNTIAVIFFFVGVQYSTLTKVNLLNMTYPIFVFILTPFINHEKIVGSYLLYLLLTCTGLYLVIIPASQGLSFKSINIGDTFGLISGIAAGFAITILRQARKYDSSHVILFYLMAIGTLINLLLAWDTLIMPNGIIFVYTLACVITAVIGQITITEGYKYISAAAGSLVSASRILFAAILGIILFNELISERVLSGGLLIIVSLAGVSGILKKIFSKKPGTL